MRVFIIAGEASGDVLGARVIDGLRDLYGQDLVLHGLGGPAMMAAGLNPLFDYGDVAVMGLVEVARHYRRLRQRLQTLKTAIADFAPDVLILIDAQGLSYRLGTHFADADFKKIQLVAPTVWAWKPERAAKAATYLDHLACLFPFEPPYFLAEGLPATFVGHPALNLRGGDKAAARQALGIDGHWAAVLPGSRGGEVRQLTPRFTPILLDAHRRGELDGVLIPVAGTVAGQVRAWAQRLPMPYKLLETAQERAHLCAADLALAASGTVSLELSAQGIPTLLAYRFHPLTWQLLRGRLTMKFMGLTNLLAGREIQREFRLNVGPQKSALARMQTAFDQLLTTPALQDQVRQDQFEALQTLDIADGLSFDRRMADLIARVIKQGDHRSEHQKNR